MAILNHLPLIIFSLCCFKVFPKQLVIVAYSFFYFRKTVITKRSFCPWSMSVQAMVMNLNFSSWRRSTWTGKVLTLSSSSSRRNFHSHTMTQWPSWTTPNLSCGVPYAETTSLGISRSFLSDLMECHSNATAGDTWPATSRETSRNFSA